MSNIENLNGGQRFNYSINLYNANTKRSVKFLPPGVMHLEIEDDINSIFHHGYIIVDNNDDYIQRVSTVYDSNNKKKNIDAYVFANNTRDLLIVNISPVVDYSNKKGASQMFKLDFIFSIYATEDIIYEGKKCKRMDFVEAEEQYFDEYIPYFSTAHYTLSLKNITKLSNEDRSMYTGDAIKACITKTLKHYNFTPSFGTFDSGYTKIFYSSPADYTTSDVIKYIQERHVSNADGGEHSLAFLTKDRTTKDYNYWSLAGLFKKAYNKGVFSDSYGDANMEHLILPAIGNTSSSKIPITSRTPSKTSTMFLNELSVIKGYNYNLASGYDINQLLNDRPVYTYSHKNGTFKVHVRDNLTTKAIDKLKTLYCSKMKGTARGGATPSINAITSLRQHINKFILEQDTNQHLAYGLNKNIFVSLFLGDSISVSLTGMTHRRTGRFIGINKEGEADKNDFDDKILGQYLTINVKHIFKKNNYDNEVIAIKPYKFS